MSPRGGRRTGAGRPPKPPEQRRRATITIALTDEEFADLQALAGDQPLALYVRDLVVRHLERKARAKER